MKLGNVTSIDLLAKALAAYLAFVYLLASIWFPVTRWTELWPTSAYFVTFTFFVIVPMGLAKTGGTLLWLLIAALVIGVAAEGSSAVALVTSSSTESVGGFEVLRVSVLTYFISRAIYMMTNRHKPGDRG